VNFEFDLLLDSKKITSSRKWLVFVYIFGFLLVYLTKIFLG